MALRPRLATGLPLSKALEECSGPRQFYDAACARIAAHAIAIQACLTIDVVSKRTRWGRSEINDRSSGEQGIYPPNPLSGPTTTG